MGEMVSIVANKARKHEAEESRAEGSMTTGNDLTTFTNEAFGTVRVAMIDGEPWLVGKDVASILGHSNSRKALADHVDDEDKGVTKCYTLGGEQELAVINESGFYSLVLGSKLPTAKAFKRWVTSEVLPSIRKNGAYMTPEKLVEVLSTPDGAQAFLTKMAELTLKNQALCQENDVLAAKVLGWDVRKFIWAAVRKYAKIYSGVSRNYGEAVAQAWGAFYYQLNYRLGINLKARVTREKQRRGNENAQVPVLSQLTDAEASEAASVITAMCREKGIALDEALTRYKTAGEEPAERDDHGGIHV